MSFSVFECNPLVEHQVIDVLSEYFSADHRGIERESSLVEDLYLDSLGVVEIVMILNDFFGIELPASGVAEWRFVADICTSVASARQFSSYDC